MSNLQNMPNSQSLQNMHFSSQNTALESSLNAHGGSLNHTSLTPNQHRFQPTKPVVYIPHTIPTHVSSSLSSQAKPENIFGENSRTNSVSVDNTQQNPPMPGLITKQGSINAMPFVPRAERKKNVLVIKRPDTNEAVKIGNDSKITAAAAPHSMEKRKKSGRKLKKKISWVFQVKNTKKRHFTF